MAISYHRFAWSDFGCRVNGISEAAGIKKVRRRD